jgi:hypothetical protein
MLNFVEGRKIARIKGGSRDGNFIYLKNEFNDNPNKNKGKLDKLDKSFFKKYNNLSKDQIIDLKKAVEKEIKPTNKKIIPAYNEALILIKKKKFPEFKEIYIPDGILQPVPNKDIVEKLYVSAPSGAGKSTYVGNWLAEARKRFRNDDIYVFSSIPEDKALDRNDPIRIKLDQELINDPIHPMEIRNSIVVFDDVDTIRDDRIRLSLEAFKDFLLEQGRHYNVRVIMTSHLLTNYKSTRRSLNEATSICLFPRSGAPNQIRKFLNDNIGIEKKKTERILKLKSRWVCLYKTSPMYIIYQKGVFMLYDD